MLANKCSAVVLFFCKRVTKKTKRRGKRVEIKRIPIRTVQGKRIFDVLVDKDGNMYVEVKFGSEKRYVSAKSVESQVAGGN